MLPTHVFRCYLDGLTLVDKGTDWNCICLAFALAAFNTMWALSDFKQAAVSWLITFSVTWLRFHWGCKWKDEAILHITEIQHWAQYRALRDAVMAACTTDFFSLALLKLMGRRSGECPNLTLLTICLSNGFSSFEIVFSAKTSSQQLVD